MNRFRTFAALAVLTALAFLPGSADASPERVGDTVWITEVQVYWGPAWSANSGDTVNVLAHHNYAGDQGWIWRCFDLGGTPNTSSHGVDQCLAIDF